jgi:hypothetical protein
VVMNRLFHLSEIYWSELSGNRTVADFVFF